MDPILLYVPFVQYLLLVRASTKSLIGPRLKILMGQMVNTWALALTLGLLLLPQLQQEKAST